MLKSIEYLELKKRKDKNDPLYSLYLEITYKNASSLFDDGEYTKSIRLLNKILSKDPNIVSVLALKMCCFKMINKRNSARRILIKLVKIEQDALILDQRFDWHSTRESFYEEALKFLDPIILENGIKDNVSIETKGKILGFLQRYDELIELIDLSYKLEPKNHGLAILKEYILYVLGKNEFALMHIDKIIKDTKTKNKKILAFREKLLREALETRKSFETN